LVVGAVADISANAVFTGNASAIYAGVGYVNGLCLVAANGVILGENWTPVAQDANTWTPVSVGGNTWTTVSSDSNTWTPVSANDNTWTLQSQGSNTWLRQN